MLHRDRHLRQWQVTEHIAIQAEEGARGVHDVGLVAGVGDALHEQLEVRGVLEGLAAKTLAEQGLSEEQKKTLQHCIQETEKLFNETDEFGDAELERYHHFNVIFHDTIIEGAQNVALIQALAKNNQLPMASAQAITYDQNQALSEYRRLHYAHLQHCSIFDALVHRQAGRAETLMREHSSVVILGETLRNVLSA